MIGLGENFSNDRCPHIRGGVPIRDNTSPANNPLSPHTWGCSFHNAVLRRRKSVVPTYVGVFRFGGGVGVVIQSCPHIRGGVPTPGPKAV